MKKKIAAAIVLMISIAAAVSSAAFAGQWQSNGNGWRWQNDDGSYAANSWQWIDGNNDGTAECYYFDGNGYLLLNTTTPDGYFVDGNGAWIVNGAVQTQAMPGTSESKHSMGNGWYQTASGSWRYQDPATGTDATDFQNIDGKWYFFSTASDNTKGDLITGLTWIGCKLYYLNPDDGGAAAMNCDYGGYHFGKYGTAVNEIGNPYIMAATDYISKIGTHMNLPIDEPAEPKSDVNNNLIVLENGHIPFADDQPACFMEDQAYEFLEILNEARRENGRPELEIDDDLMEAARIRAMELPELYSYDHMRPNGEPYYTVFDDLGIRDNYKSVSENCNMFKYDPEEAYLSWYNSPGHRNNMFANRWTKTGIACYYDPDSSAKYWWVQTFAN